MDKEEKVASDTLALELEHLLRHLENTKPKTKQWMNMGKVERFAKKGFIDADNFRSGTDAQIKGLFEVVKILAQKCAFLEEKITKLKEI